MDEQKSKSERILGYFIPWFLVAVACLTLIAAILRVIGIGVKPEDRLDQTTLLYFVASGALLLLRNVKSFAFGNTKLEFLEKTANEAKVIARNAQDTAASLLPGGKAPLKVSATTKKPGSVNNDPWKDVFGGKCASNNRLLSAKVYPVGDNSGWYLIDVVVESTLPAKDPLKGAVQFFLHDTFPEDKPVVPVSPNGLAGMRLKAWGAFTIGALADDGKTELELDLADLKDVPKEFRDR